MNPKVNPWGLHIHIILINVVMVSDAVEHQYHERTAFFNTAKSLFEGF